MAAYTQIAKIFTAIRRVDPLYMMYVPVEQPQPAVFTLAMRFGSDLQSYRMDRSE